MSAWKVSYADEDVTFTTSNMSQEGLSSPLSCAGSSSEITRMSSASFAKSFSDLMAVDGEAKDESLDEAFAMSTPFQLPQTTSGGVSPSKGCVMPHSSSSTEQMPELNPKLLRRGSVRKAVSAEDTIPRFGEKVSEASTCFPRFSSASSSDSAEFARLSRSFAKSFTDLVAAESESKDANFRLLSCNARAPAGY